MFVFPLLLLVGLGIAALALVHRRRHPVAATGHGGLLAAPRAAFWPTSTYGRLGTAALAVMILMMALVNVVQIPSLQWSLVLVAAILTALARFTRDDRSTAVLVVLVVSSLAFLAATLFLAGEVFIGHD